MLKLVAPDCPYFKSDIKKGTSMKKVTIFWLISILVLFLPFTSSGAQTKGIEIVVIDSSGRKVGLYKGSHALVIMKKDKAKPIVRWLRKTTDLKR